MKELAAFSYRQRNGLLLLGSFIMLLVVGLFYLAPTLTAWQDNRQRRQALTDLARAPVQIQQFAEQARADTWLMRSYRIDTTRHESRMLNQLSGISRRYGVTLAALSLEAPTVHAGYRVQTRIAKLRGAFPGLVKAVYELEYQQPVGRLASVRFLLEEDRKQRRSFLVAYLYLQSITQEPPNEKSN